MSKQSSSSIGTVEPAAQDRHSRHDARCWPQLFHLEGRQTCVVRKDGVCGKETPCVVWFGLASRDTGKRFCWQFIEGAHFVHHMGKKSLSLATLIG